MYAKICVMNQLQVIVSASVFWEAYGIILIDWIKRAAVTGNHVIGMREC